MRPAMRWVLHGKLTTAAADALVRHGHKAVAASELELPQDATPRQFFSAAQAKQLDVISAEGALVNAIFAENDKIGFNRVVVYLQLEGGDVEQDDAIDR